MSANLSTFMIHSLIAALRAGEAILSVYNKEFSVSYKEDRSPLTLADRKAHDIIMATLSDGFLDRLPVLSEEGKSIPYAERNTWNRFWLVDPLDGTKEFVKRNGEFTVNIALIDGNYPSTGVIYTPANDLLYFAGKGLGAYKTTGTSAFGIFRMLIPGFEKFGIGMPARVEHPEKLSDAICSGSTRLTPECFREPTRRTIRIIGSRSHSDKALTDFAERLNARYEKVENLSIGSSLKFCMVAEGNGDLYPRFGPTMEWDTAAGDIIVKEAGGRVVDVKTFSDLVYNKQNLLNPSFIVMSGCYYENELSLLKEVIQ